MSSELTGGVPSPTEPSIAASPWRAARRRVHPSDSVSERLACSGSQTFRLYFFQGNFDTWDENFHTEASSWESSPLPSVVRRIDCDLISTELNGGTCCCFVSINQTTARDKCELMSEALGINFSPEKKSCHRKQVLPSLYGNKACFGIMHKCYLLKNTPVL